ncbi:MAG: hypothetical protein ACK4VV_08290, partial [Pseudomonas sp.]
TPLQEMALTPLAGPVTSQLELRRALLERDRSEKAARLIISGIEKGRREIAFPGPFISILKLIGGLPGSLRLALTKGLARPTAEQENS